MLCVTPSQEMLDTNNFMAPPRIKAFPYIPLLLMGTSWSFSEEIDV